MLSLLGASLKKERIQVRVLDLEASPHRFADERFETGIPGPGHGSLLKSKVNGSVMKL